MTIQEIYDREQWNTFLQSHPQGHFLQSYEWGELNKVLGRRIYRLGALQEGRLVGAMMLVVSTVPLPLPRVRPNWLYCGRGPVLARPDALILANFLDYVAYIAHQEHAVVLRVEPNIADDNPDLDAWLAIYHKAGFYTNPVAVHGRRSWVLDLRPSFEQLQAQFTVPWQRNIRSAEDQGVVVRVARGQADFHVFYELLKQTGERESFVVHSKEYYQHIFRLFAHYDDSVLYLAEYEGMVIGVRYLLRFGDWCWDMFDAVSDDCSHLHAAFLLQCYALRWAHEQGCRYFDFRTIPEVLAPGEDFWDLYEYKRGFGGGSRLTMPTQDYVYQPLVYKPWRKIVELRREQHTQRHVERQNVELERYLSDKTE
jgi:lipid II:glycine glycyltransferase (peptidoglycan interpeptide bridge formation enzyme)